jgi:hypothetical protein
MNLPESVLLCLFPNGLVLSRQSTAMDGAGEDDEDDDVFVVDFDPDCFQFVLSFFRTASDTFYGSESIGPGLFAAQQHLLDSPSNATGMNEFNTPPPSQNPLISKQAIIVLREELEYFAIPPKGAISGGEGEDSLMRLKQRCGDYLMSKKSIFTALQRNVNKENNVAEQHLIDMLCMSGFDREDEWGFRALEPSRCCISSIALVLLKTGIIHHPGEQKPVEVDYAQMGTAQKLLLFWRKPARKCWWDGLDIELPATPDANGSEPDGSKTIKLWARRVWTLELSLI